MRDFRYIPTSSSKVNDKLLTHYDVLHTWLGKLPDKDEYPLLPLRSLNVLNKIDETLEKIQELYLKTHESENLHISVALGVHNYRKMVNFEKVQVVSDAMDRLADDAFLIYSTQKRLKNHAAFERQYVSLMAALVEFTGEYRRTQDIQKAIFMKLVALPQIIEELIKIGKQNEVDPNQINRLEMHLNRVKHIIKNR